MASLDLPYRCPRCGEHKRFRSLSSLRAHLEYNHTYETLYVLSKSNSICDASVDKSVLIPTSCKEIFESTSFRSKEQRYLYDLQCGDDLPLGSTCYFPEVEVPVNDILMRKAVTSSAPPAALAAAAVDAVYEEGLARLKIQALEKLDLNERLEKLSEEVEQKITARVDKLQTELEKKSSELEKAKQESVKLSQEKQDLEEKASELSRQVDVSVEMLATLKQDLVQKDQELARKQQFKYSNKNVLLQVNRTYTGEVPENLRNANMVPLFKKRSVNLSFCVGAVSTRPKPVAHLSRCYDSDSFTPSVDMQHNEQSPERIYFHKQSRSPESRCIRDPMSRSSALRRQAVENWHRRPYRNSTEGEEGDVSDAGSRTTESEAEIWEPESKCSAEIQKFGSNRAKAYRLGATSQYDPVKLSPGKHAQDIRYRFMVTLSQWCTQTHSLTLQGIKPRPKGKKESKEEYLKNTHGCLETGLESLLKAAGSNLLILKVSHCPNILTDRSLWLASCYCRALQAVTYRRPGDCIPIYKTAICGIISWRPLPAGHGEHFTRTTLGCHLSGWCANNWEDQ
ncbi:F-box only protein 41-like [Rhincodon typus]|uniref:F-box only protein 41-like n=1 Tax=Rhincodon typus TaxID=259920 RepID=UPI00202E0D89|nr:F-box only protein 41-like [Rhincodon typus]